MEDTLINREDKNSVELKNSQLGEFEIDVDSIIHFENGIFGYEFLKKFCIINIMECEPFLWLVAVDEPEISLPLLKYSSVYPDYKFSLSDKDRQYLKLGESDTFFLFFTVTVDEKQASVTANLKGPIVINIEEHLGLQLISPYEEHVIDFPIVHNNQ